MSSDMLCSPSQPHRLLGFLTLQQLGIWAHAHSGHSTIKQFNLLQLQCSSRKELDPALWGPLEIGIAPCGGRTSLAGQPGMGGDRLVGGAGAGSGGQRLGSFGTTPRHHSARQEAIRLTERSHLVKEKKKGVGKQGRARARYGSGKFYWLSGL